MSFRDFFLSSAACFDHFVAPVTTVAVCDCNHIVLSEVLLISRLPVLLALMPQIRGIAPPNPKVLDLFQVDSAPHMLSFGLVPSGFCSTFWEYWFAMLLIIPVMRTDQSGSRVFIQQPVSCHFQPTSPK
jgi:hypothetical protein